MILVGESMPNRSVHIATSSPAGAVFAHHKAPLNNEIHRFQETLGGAVGGLLGGVLPDVLDPPFHPGHRALAHALIPVGASAAAWIRGLDGWQGYLRRKADDYSRLRLHTADPLLAAWYGAVAIALRMLSGLLAGLVAGYLTHIALDFTTPRCLPLVS